MAVITPDTFNPLRRFVSVRLQQGVPIVDAEWNEKDDVRRFELRAYLKWFVGDGVPFGSDAFRIEAAAVPAANEFMVRAGVPPPPVGTDQLVTGLRHVGRCLVDGLDALIGSDIAFRAQALHVAVPTSAATAVLFGTVVIPELPVLNGVVLVYLDVWDRLVRPDEDPTLVFPDIGTETCARLRREWAVRARVAAVVPALGDADHEANHSYYALAQIARVAADPIVFPSQIEDLRERRLLTPPATLIEDLLGTTPDRYRRGLDRPAISLRDAVNALLRGELPASADRVVAPDPAADAATRGLLAIGSERAIFWHSSRVAPDQVFAASWPASAPNQASTNPPIQITSGAVAARWPSAVLLPTSPLSSIFVAYETGAPSNNIAFRRAATIPGLSTAAEDPVTAQAEPETQPFAIRTGSIVTVFWHWNGPGTGNEFIRYRRRQYTAAWNEAGAAWLDPETQQLSTLVTTLTATGLLHAAADSLDRVWVAFQTAATNIAVVRLTPGTGAVETFTNLQLDSGTNDLQPFVLVDEPNLIWVFWRADGGIFHQTFNLTTSIWAAVATAVPGTTGAPGSNGRPYAVRDPQGGIWLFWTRTDATTGPDVWVVRRNPFTGGWGDARQITASPNTNDFATATAEGSSITVFFRSDRAGTFDLYFKQVVTAV